jgi:hypothetical protein
MPVPKKRGRPPKGERAMTPAERKARSRSDIERRNLVAEFIKRTKRGLTDIVGAGELRDQERANQRKRMRQLRDDLLMLSIDDLRNTVATLKELSDSSGRLRNERSGEKSRASGMSEIERIVSMRERDEDGRKVKPEGTAPTPFEIDDTADKADNHQSFDRGAARTYIRSRLDNDLTQKKLDDKITAIAQWAYSLPDFRNHCRLCGHEATSTQGREDHVWGAYERGLRLEDVYHEEQRTLLDCTDPTMTAFVQERVDAARIQWLDDKHARTIAPMLRKRIM